MSKNVSKQREYEVFRENLKLTVTKEFKVINDLSLIKALLNDKDLNKFISKRESFFEICNKYNEQLKVIENYSENPALIDKIQKEYYMNMDDLRKEALFLLARNQRIWFAKLFQNNFDMLKFLLRNILISYKQSDLTNIERMVQEIELLKRNG